MLVENMGLVHAWWSHLYSGRKGSHLFHGRSHAAAWEALLEGRVWHLAICGWRGKVWPGSPSSLMWCDSRFFSKEVKLLVASVTIGIRFMDYFILPDISVHGRCLNNLWADDRVWWYFYMSHLQKFWRCFLLSSDCQHFTQHSHRVGSAWL